jgi:crotonobetainyl-CoA:carnitine CoA-transferase CaiB-like acyl-CoA transferase
MSKSLSGILVVSLEHAVAAPLASCRLADAGARVIKLERPTGDFARGYDRAANGLSSYFAWLNRGKESIAVDLRNQQDHDLIERMLSRADIFIQNLAVDAAERAGFGSAQLRKRYPKLITCDITGYGDRGPYRDMKAYDLLVQAESGLLSISGPPGPIGRVGVSVCDIGAGLNAAQAILEALILRARTGVGTGIRISLFDSIAEWMTVPALHTTYLGEAPQRVGVAHPSIAPYGEFRTRDGSSVIISIQNEREWQRFANAVLLKHEWCTDPRFHTNVERVRNRALLDGEVQAITATLTRDELIRRLRREQIAYGLLNDMEGLLAHPQLRMTRVQTECGEVSYPAPAIQSEDQAPFGPVPGLNQHGEALRREFS